MLFSIEAHLKTDFVKSKVQDFFALLDQFLAAFTVFILVHKSAQPGLLLGKGFPCRLCPLPKAFFKSWEGDTLFTVIYEHLRILVAGTGLQRLAEIRQCPALLVEIVIGITHAEIPAMVACKIFLMGGQQSNRFFKQLPIPKFRQIVVGSCQFAVHLRGTLLGRDSLQRINDLLVFVVFIPNLALFQQFHLVFLLNFQLQPIPRLKHQPLSHPPARLLPAAARLTAGDRRPQTLLSAHIASILLHRSGLGRGLLLP